MRPKILGLFVMASLVAVMVMSLGSAAGIFSDDFEDGTLDAWTVTNNLAAFPWVASGDDPFDGTYAAQAEPQFGTHPATSMELVLSTLDYEDLNISYERELVGIDPTDEFKVSWYDGSSWVVLEETMDTGVDDSNYKTKTFLLPTTAEDNADFKLKFECTADAAGEFCRVDNVTIEGSKIPQVVEEILPEEISECIVTKNLGGNLKVDIDDISVESGFGEDEIWFPLDTIEVEVEVQNNGPEDIEDLVIEWGLFNADTGEWVLDGEEDDFNLKDDDEETILISFKLDEVDEFENGGDYIFYVWATGEDEEFDNNDTCAYTSDSSVDIEIVKDFVILDEIEYYDTAGCGDDVQLTADVWNVGERDQEDVIVVVYNKELGLNEIVNIGDVDKFDNSKVPFNYVFNVPVDAEEKGYVIKLSVYDEDNDVFENNFDENEEESVFTVPLKVEGSCIAESTGISVLTSLESDARAGKDLVVKVTVTNTGTEDLDLVLNAAGYTEWALSSDYISEVSLNAGESKDVLFTFETKDDIEGEYGFNVEVLSESELLAVQPVDVLFEKKGWSITGAAIGENAYVWGLGIINLILLILIIVVAVKVAKK